MSLAIYDITQFQKPSLTETTASYDVDTFKNHKEFHRLLRRVLSPSEYVVFCVLEDRASDKNDGWCWGSHSNIGKECNIKSRETVMIAINKLVELGLLEEVASDLDQAHAYKPAKSTCQIIRHLSELTNLSEIPTRTCRKNRQPPVGKSDTNVTNNNVTNINVNNIVSTKVEHTPPETTFTYPVKEDGTNKTTTSNKKVSATGKEKKPVDPNSEHPAVQYYHAERRRYPNKEQMKAIAEKVVNLESWKTAMSYWQLAGYSPVNIGGMLDWYDKLEKGIDPRPGRNKPAQTYSSSKPAFNKAMLYGKEGRMTDEQLQSSW